MENYPWYFRAAMNTFQNKGLKYLLRKSVRYASLSFFSSGGDQWWNSYKGLNDAQEKILGFVAERSQRDPDAGQEYLENVFIKNMQVDQGLPGEYVTALLQSIEKRHVFRDYRSSVQDNLLQQTLEIDPSCLPCKKWLTLQYFCIRNGFFKTASVVRQKAVEKALLDAGNHRPDNIDIAFKACIDQAEFEKARIYLDQMRKRNSKYLFKERESYFNLNTGNIEKFQEGKKSSIDSLDQKFWEKIKGKSIAIVGPAPSGDEHGEEIDSFDVVVRINYRGREKIVNWNEFGKKTDISYYNMNFIKDIIKSEKKYFQETQFSVFKKVDYEIQEQLIKSQNGRIWKSNELFFNGSPLTGSVAIFDILHFRPALVKMFNVNFYLSNRPYYSGYISGVRGAFIDDNFTNYFDNFNFGSFAEHDLISNINFIRNLWNAGLIEVDPACEKVIGLTTIEYLSALEKLFIPAA